MLQNQKFSLFVLVYCLSNNPEKMQHDFHENIRQTTLFNIENNDKDFLSYF